MVDQIKAALEEVRPALQQDGGDVEFVGFEDGVVSVRLVGRCGGCPMSQMTLKMFIENTLKARVAGVTEVIGV